MDIREVTALSQTNPPNFEPVAIEVAQSSKLFHTEHITRSECHII